MATIVDLAVANPDFSTLVTALKAADLVGALQGPGPFTVFAPIDSAFEKLPPGTIQTLVQNIPQLTRILTYHVVLGEFYEFDLPAQKTLTSLEGSDLLIRTQPRFEVKNAAVIAGNIKADNGVIHCIDTVLLMG